MNRLKNWLANQYWEWGDVGLLGAGLAIYGLLSILVALVVSVVAYGTGPQGEVRNFGTAWLLGNGIALGVWGLAWVGLQLPEWARRVPAKPDAKPQGVVDWLKEQALRELDEQFPADKETK